MLPEEGSFNVDQFIVSEIEEGVEIEIVSGSPDVLSENHGKREERDGRGSPYFSTPLLGNGIDIPSALLLQQSENLSGSVVDNTQHVIVNASNPEPCPAPITILPPPTNQLFPSLLVEAVQQEQNFVSVDQADGMNFAYQDQSMMPPNTLNPDNSFQMDTQMISNQDVTFSLHDPASNGFGYVPPEISPELLVRSSGLQLPPYSEIGVGVQNNGTNFVHGTTNWGNMHGNTFGSQDVQFQQDLNGGMDGRGSFYAGGSTPNQFQFPNMPYIPDGNQGGNLGSNNRFEAGQSSSTVKIGMNMQNEMVGFYDQDGNYISNVQDTGSLTRNSVYDPMYEAMGLPLDPHLRIFLTQRGHDGLEYPAGKTNDAGGKI